MRKLNRWTVGGCPGAAASASAVMAGASRVQPFTAAAPVEARLTFGRLLWAGIKQACWGTCCFWIGVGLLPMTAGSSIFIVPPLWFLKAWFMLVDDLGK